jgi:hypothetical protein
VELFARWQAWRAERRRIAAIQAACDHDWKVVNTHYGQALNRNFTYECRKCGKLGSTPAGEGPPR